MKMFQPKIPSVLDPASKNGKENPRCGEHVRHRRESRDQAAVAVAVAWEEDMIQERGIEQEVQSQQSGW